jgi:hypothetical protein
MQLYSNADEFESTRTFSMAVVILSRSRRGCDCYRQSGCDVDCDSASVMKLMRHLTAGTGSMVGAATLFKCSFYVSIQLYQF